MILTPPSKPILLVALGGNALIRKGERGTVDEQFANLRLPLSQVARLAVDYRIIITHGNGPQVGHLLLRQESCPDLPRLPLEILVAQTQGQLGYMIESTLDTELMALGIHTRPIVSLISYVVVDENDPAFADPQKPIGPVYTETEARTKPFAVKQTAKGWRRVVVSPQPITIVEKREIRTLIEADFIVICCGGGGIPVIREGRTFCGVDAVIDKDLASAKLAQEVGVDIFIIATDVPGAIVDYGTDRARLQRRLSGQRAEALLTAGQFPTGSMGPKVAAALQFVRATGRRAVITGIDAIAAAVDGTTGTEIVP